MRHETLNPNTAQPIGGAFPDSFSLVRCVRCSTRYPESQSLPIGAQARLTRAAIFSARIGHPVNTLLTVNAAHLQRVGAGGVFGIGHLWDGFRDFLELVRKWVTARGVPWVALWVREYAGGKHGQVGEHWHIAHHLPAGLRADFAAQVAIWTDESIGGNQSGGHTIARSSGRAWHYRSSAPSGNGPDGLGAYLGKSEPSWVKRYGRTVPNRKKLDRRKNGGGGPIQGKRYGISRPIGDTAQARA